MLAIKELASQLVSFLVTAISGSVISNVAFFFGVFRRITLIYMASHVSRALVVVTLNSLLLFSTGP